MEETEFKGIERLKTMLAEFTDGYSLKAVVEYLFTRTDMDQNYLNEEKNLKDMEEHIREKAKNQAVNNVAVIGDKMVYSWAILYFTLSNDLLGIKKTPPKVEAAAKTKPAKKSAAKETVVETADIKEVENAVQKVDSPQMSIFKEVV